MPTLLKACARVGSDAAVAGAVNPELSNAAAGSRAVTAAVSSIRRDLLMARLLTAGGAATHSPLTAGGARSTAPSQRAAHGAQPPSQRAALARTALPDPPAPGPALPGDVLAVTLAVTRPAGAFFQKISAFPWLQREICRAATAVPGRHSTATLGRLKRTQRRHARPPSTPPQRRPAGSPRTANTPACPAQPRPHPAQRNAALAATLRDWQSAAKRDRRGVRGSAVPSCTTG